MNDPKLNPVEMLLLDEGFKDWLRRQGQKFSKFFGKAKKLVFGDDGQPKPADTTTATATGGTRGEEPPEEISVKYVSPTKVRVTAKDQNKAYRHAQALAARLQNRMAQEFNAERTYAGPLKPNTPRYNAWKARMGVEVKRGHLTGALQAALGAVPAYYITRTGNGAMIEFSLQDIHKATGYAGYYSARKTRRNSLVGISPDWLREEKMKQVIIPTEALLAKRLAEMAEGEPTMLNLSVGITENGQCQIVESGSDADLLHTVRLDIPVGMTESDFKEAAKNVLGRLVKTASKTNLTVDFVGVSRLDESKQAKAFSRVKGVKLVETGRDSMPMKEEDSGGPTRAEVISGIRTIQKHFKKYPQDVKTHGKGDGIPIELHYSEKQKGTASSAAYGTSVVTGDGPDSVLLPLGNLSREEISSIADELLATYSGPMEGRRRRSSVNEKRGGMKGSFLPGTNLMFMGFKMDTNGNKTIRLKKDGGRVFSIQTNGNLPNTHRIAGSVMDLSSVKQMQELSSDDLGKISKEVKAYVSEHGSSRQKSDMGESRMRRNRSKHLSEVLIRGTRMVVFDYGDGEAYLGDDGLIHIPISVGVRLIRSHGEVTVGTAYEGDATVNPAGDDDPSYFDVASDFEYYEVPDQVDMPESLDQVDGGGLIYVRYGHDKLDDSEVDFSNVRATSELITAWESDFGDFAKWGDDDEYDNDMGESTKRRRRRIREERDPGKASEASSDGIKDGKQAKKDKVKSDELMDEIQDYGGYAWYSDGEYLDDYLKGVQFGYDKGSSLKRPRAKRGRYKNESAGRRRRRVSEANGENNTVRRQRRMDMFSDAKDIYDLDERRLVKIIQRESAENSTSKVSNPKDQDDVDGNNTQKRQRRKEEMDDGDDVYDVDERTAVQRVKGRSSKKPIREAGKRRNKSSRSVPDKHQLRILKDTVRNPAKSLLGGPSAREAEETLRRKFGYTDAQIAKLKESRRRGKR